MIKIVFIAFMIRFEKTSGFKRHSSEIVSFFYNFFFLDGNNRNEKFTKETNIRMMLFNWMDVFKGEGIRRMILVIVYRCKERVIN
jgi:hypothetical protein